MCVLAGYIGDRSAAPILLEMLRRQEGMGGGHYSGLVTIDDRSFHTDKVIGDSRWLADVTDVARFPGTIGLAHGRTPDGGDREWAHPFLGSKAPVAYIANGGRGAYGNQSGTAHTVAALEDLGITFATASEHQVRDHPRLADGRCVHVSEVMCQQLSTRLAVTEPSGDQMRRVLCEVFSQMPAEITCMTLHADNPDALVALRHNKPLNVGVGPDGGVYLATTAMAFPDEGVTVIPVPPSSTVIARRNGDVTIRPINDGDLVAVGDMPELSWVIDQLLAEINGGEVAVDELFRRAKSWWPDGTLSQAEMTVLGGVASMLRQGQAKLVRATIDGFGEGCTAPEDRLVPISTSTEESEGAV